MPTVRMGRLTATPAAWNASEELYALAQTDRIAPSMMATRATSPAAPPPTSPRMPAAVWLPPMTDAADSPTTADHTPAVSVPAMTNQNTLREEVPGGIRRPKSIAYGHQLSDPDSTMASISRTAPASAAPCTVRTGSTTWCAKIRQVRMPNRTVMTGANHASTWLIHSYPPPARKATAASTMSAPAQNGMPNSSEAAWAPNRDTSAIHPPAVRPCTSAGRATDFPNVIRARPSWDTPAFGPQVTM